MPRGMLGVHARGVCSGGIYEGHTGAIFRGHVRGPCLGVYLGPTVCTSGADLGVGSKYILRGMSRGLLGYS